MDVLNIFTEVGKDPGGYVTQLKKKYPERSIIGYFCSYTPEEIIHASGSLPFRIFGTGERITLADGHLQSYCCSLARGGLEEALSGRLGFLSGTVFPHTCDTIQRLSDIWRLNTNFDLHLDVILPVKLNTESARDYFREVLHKFRHDLEKGLGIIISNEDIKESILLYNKMRSILLDIYILRSKDPGIISDNDVYRMMKSSMIMDRSEFLENAEKALAHIKMQKGNRGKNPGHDRKRLMLAGGICNHPDIYSILNESGGTVAWDDLCTGTRHIEGQISTDNDPIDAIAERYMNRIVCPAKHMSSTARGENLVRLAREHGIQGVLFIFLKFCDPHRFDYPFLKECLDKEGIPSMLLEIEEQLPPQGQLQTRLETFIETIGQGKDHV